MYLLKLTVAFFISKSLLTVECCEEYNVKRMKNHFGLFVPIIDRVTIPPGLITDPSRPGPYTEVKTFAATEIEMNHLLRNLLDKIPLMTYVNPTVNMRDGVHDTYNFRFNTFSASDVTVYTISFRSKSECTITI